jgi:hypothetical protein
MTIKQINDVYLSIPDDVKTALIGMGVPVNPIEDSISFNGEPYCGILPKSLDDLDTSDIVSLMSAHIAWTRYINGLLSDAIVQLKCREDALSAIKATLIKTKGKDSVEFDQDYIKANSSVLWWSTMKIYLESASDMCAQHYKVLSRVVTLRGQDQEQVIRVNTAARGNESTRRRPRPWDDNSQDN